MNVLQIGSDRSKRGILHRGTPAFERQQAYARQFGRLDIIGFSLQSDGAAPVEADPLRIYPTNSASKAGYVFDALRIAKQRSRPDVVSAQDPFEAGLVGWLIARRFRVPLHVQLHTDPWSPAFGRSSPLNGIRLALARFVLKRASRIRVVSSNVERSLETNLRLGIPVTVLPIFVDIGAYKNADAPAERAAKFAAFKSKLLVVARLEPEKNIELAIRSFARSAPHGTCLLIVGEGSESDRLKVVARDLHVADRVFFEGAQDPAPYYALADLVLVPSRYEGYGLVIVEALAAGKPVLSTDVGIAREAGAIVTNEKDFASDLEKWFSSGPRTAQLKQYPYRSFDEYVRAYAADIEACTKKTAGE